MGFCQTLLHSVFVILTLWQYSHAKLGYFWHITDLHLDVNYSTGGSRDRLCWGKGGSSYRSSERKFGDYGCDSPLALVQSAIKAMKKAAYNDIEFILWSGNSIAHSTYNDENIDDNTIFHIIQNITSLLEVEFPYANIYPVLGNMDVFPRKKASVTKHEFNQTLWKYSQLWSKWVPPESMKTFQTGGFYSIEQRNRKLKLLILNTSLFIKRSWLIGADKDDPLNQFRWLKRMLAAAKRKGETVYIVGHFPPGKMERYMSSRWGFDVYQQHFNKQYLRLVREYHSVIAGQFFGHFHSDSFRVFYEKNEEKRNFLDRTPISYLFLAPAVSPKKSVVADEIGPTNPGIRLYKYNVTSGQVFDYSQYYLNLTRANERNQDDWEILYNLTSYYNLRNVSAESLSELAFSFRNRSERFEKYIFANSVGYEDPKSCTNLCRRTHFCVVSNVDYADYDFCIQTVFGGAQPLIVMDGLIIFTFLVVIRWTQIVP